MFIIENFNYKDINKGINLILNKNNTYSKSYNID